MQQAARATNPISSGKANNDVVAAAVEKGFLDCDNELYLIFSPLDEPLERPKNPSEQVKGVHVMGIMKGVLGDRGLSLRNIS